MKEEQKQRQGDVCGAIKKDAIVLLSVMLVFRGKPIRSQG